MSPRQEPQENAKHSLVGMQVCIVNLPCVGVNLKRGQTLPNSFDMDDRICLKLQQVIDKVSFYLTMKSF